MPPTPDVATGVELRLRDKKAAKGIDDDENVRPLGQIKSPLDKKYHKDRGTLITWNNKANFTEGFMNLVFCAICCASVGQLFESINKNGFRVSMTNLLRAADARNTVTGFYPAGLLFIYMPVQIFVALIIEKSIARGLLREQVGLRAHAANLVWHFAYPILGIWLAGDSISIMGGCLVCAQNAVILLKVWSFAHTCWWARDKLRHTSKEVHPVGDTTVPNGSVSELASSETVYPANLTVANLAYFTFAPTLCYEMDYPRKPSTNWRVVASRAAMLFLGVALIVALVQQWAIPSVVAAAAAFARRDWAVFVEHMLKIAIPSHLVWITLFFTLFQANIPLWGELLRFGDCHSYENWWDAEDMAMFWRRWNLPVHKWCTRHVYLPLVRQDYSQRKAVLAVFALSAVFHEYLISPATRMFGGYTTFAMMCHVPLCNITDWMRTNCGPRWSNAFIWFVIIIGSSLCIVLHVHDYQIATNGAEALAALERSLAATS